MYVHKQDNNRGRARFQLAARRIQSLFRHRRAMSPSGINVEFWWSHVTLPRNGIQLTHSSSAWQVEDDQEVITKVDDKYRNSAGESPTQRNAASQLTMLANHVTYGPRQRIHELRLFCGDETPPAQNTRSEKGGSRGCARADWRPQKIDCPAWQIRRGSFAALTPDT